MNFIVAYKMRNDVNKTCHHIMFKGIIIDSSIDIIALFTAGQENKLVTVLTRI